MSSSLPPCRLRRQPNFAAIASAWGTAIGAEIMGRNKFRPTTGPWPEDGWRGWWGGDPPFHTPCLESVYIDMPQAGLARFAPATPARGSLFSARRRLGMRETSQPPPGIAEDELYQR